MISTDTSSCKGYVKNTMKLNAPCNSWYNLYDREKKKTNHIFKLKLQVKSMRSMIDVAIP